MGHISLSAFNARALSDVVAAVRQTEAAGAAELVLDLRDNRGGLVQEGIEIAKLFLDGAPLLFACVFLWVTELKRLPGAEA